MSKHTIAPFQLVYVIDPVVGEYAFSADVIHFPAEMPKTTHVWTCLGIATDMYENPLAAFCGYN